MTIYDLRSGESRLAASCLFIIMLIITTQPAMSAAAENDCPVFQAVLRDSLTALWTGREFSPELSQPQQALKTMLATGAVNQAQIEAIIEAEILYLLDHHRTSRYILKTAPGIVDALFAPALNWKTFRTIMWRAAASPASKSEPLVIKMSTLAPSGTPWIVVFETTCAEIKKLTDGKIQLKIYTGGVMGEDADILRKIDVGQLDGCGCTAIGVLTASPETSALLLPTLFNNYEEVDYILEKFRKRLDKNFEEKGYILTSLIDTGFFYFFAKHRITGLEDIKKQKPCTWFGVVESTLFQELGINATPLAVPEAVASFSTGLVDTVMGPAAWFLGMQAYQYMNYYLKPPLIYSPAALIVSTHAKDRLQKQMGVSENFAFNVQEILVSELNAIEPEWKRQVRNYEAKCLEAFETKCGIKAMSFSPEDRQLIKKAGQNVQRKLAGKIFPEDLINDIRKALEEYRASH